MRQLPIEHASPVRPGDTLAVLENTDLQVQLHQTNEELASSNETIKLKETEIASADAGRPPHSA